MPTMRLRKQSYRGDVGEMWGDMGERVRVRVRVRDRDRVRVGVGASAVWPRRSMAPTLAPFSRSTWAAWVGLGLGSGFGFGLGLGLAEP